MGLTRITSDGITDGSIVNADINGSAAIAGSKLNTNFGSSGMTATGSCSFGNITISNVAPKIFLTDSDTDSDFSIRNMHGVFGIHDQTNSADRLTITSDGHIRIPADDKKLQIGASQDLQIYHDGTDTVIANTTGNLYILDDNAVILGSNSGTESYFKGVKDGAAELYHDNVKTFFTTAVGIQVQGGSGGTGQIVLSADANEDNADKFKLVVEDDGPFKIQNRASGVWETNIECNGNGNVELYYDNSKKLETTSGGGTLTGDWSVTNDFFWADNGEAVFGTGGDLKIYHDGTSSILKNTTGALYVQSDDTRIVNAANSETIARFIADGAVELYHNSGKKFETTSEGAKVTGNLGINVASPDSPLEVGGTGPSLATIHHTDGSTNDEARIMLGALSSNPPDQRGAGISARNKGAGHDLEIQTSSTHSAGPSTKMTVTAGGQVQIANDSGRLQLGASQDLQLYHNGSNSFITNNTGQLEIRSDTLLLQDNTNGHTMVKGVADGAVELYYDNSKKLETKSDGIDVTGEVQCDSLDVDGTGNINGGTGNGANDATLYVTADNNNDWGLRVDKYRSSANEYGVQIDVGSGATYALRIRGNTSETFRIEGNGTVRATTYYGDGSNLSGIASFASGTVMLFQQTNAPTGWTKLTSHNNKALRLVSGTPGTGGSNTFTTAFNSSRSTSGGSVSNHTLSVSQIPSHNHTFSINNEYNQLFYPNQGIVARGENKSGIDTYSTSSTGSGSSHNHGFSNPSLNLNVQYVDVIMASKD